VIISLLFLTAFSQTTSAAPFSFPTPARSTAPINVIYPTEGLDLPQMDHEFLIGFVSDPSGKLAINGQTVPVYKDGAFATWLPVEPGNFTFHCELSLSSAAIAYDRHVVFAVPPKPLPLSPLAIVPSSLYPGENEVLRPGDWLVARMQATPRQKAQFWVPTAGWLPMNDAGGNGFYEGAYQVRPGDRSPPFAVKFRVGGWWGVSALSAAKISFTESSPRIAVATDSADVIVKTGPEQGNLFSVLKGMPFVIVGREGGWDKIWLSPNETGWLEADNLQTLPAGAPPPNAELSAISTRPSDEGTSVLFAMDQRVPFRLTESDDLRTITVRLYYTRSHDNWIIYRPKDALVSSISFSQDASDAVDVRINLKKSAILWGYRASYEDDSVRIDLRQAPHLAAAPRSPLYGLRVFLDPGHMPSKPGALGCLGTREMDVNYAIALETEALLKKQGAVPLISRPNDQSEVGLVARPEAAAAEHADLFVSIHNNNTSDGQNPYDSPHGYSMFYYHPHSLALARAIYASEEKILPIPGEDVRFGNLLVTRMTTYMPAVLSESAYMTLPEQEALLLTPAFREKIAESLVAGMRSFLDSVRDQEAAARSRRDSTARRQPRVPQKPQKQKIKPRRKQWTRHRSRRRRR